MLRGSSTQVRSAASTWGLTSAAVRLSWHSSRSLRVAAGAVELKWVRAARADGEVVGHAVVRVAGDATCGPSGDATLRSAVPHGHPVKGRL